MLRDFDFRAFFDSFVEYCFVDYCRHFRNHIGLRCGVDAVDGFFHQVGFERFGNKCIFQFDDGRLFGLADEFRFRLGNHVSRLANEFSDGLFRLSGAGRHGIGDSCRNDRRGGRPDVIQVDSEELNRRFGNRFNRVNHVICSNCFGHRLEHGVFDRRDTFLAGDVFACGFLTLDFFRRQDCIRCRRGFFHCCRRSCYFCIHVWRHVMHRQLDIATRDRDIGIVQGDGRDNARQGFGVAGLGGIVHRDRR